MTTSLATLQKLADLARLELGPVTTEQLSTDVNAIMTYVAQLKQVDTTGIAPLHHPLDLPQPLRQDEITEPNCLAELKTLTNDFSESMYWIPAVLGSKE